VVTAKVKWTGKTSKHFTNIMSQVYLLHFYEPIKGNCKVKETIEICTSDIKDDIPLIWSTGPARHSYSLLSAGSLAANITVSLLTPERLTWLRVKRIVKNNVN